MIRKMKNKKAYAVSDKLQSERGFTLAELLATIAIMAIVMGVVAGGASSLIKVYKSIRLRADAQTLLSTSVMAVSDEMYTHHLGQQRAGREAAQKGLDRRQHGTSK